MPTPNNILHERSYGIIRLMKPKLQILKLRCIRPECGNVWHQSVTELLTYVQCGVCLKFQTPLASAEIIEKPLRLAYKD